MRAIVNFCETKQSLPVEEGFTARTIDQMPVAMVRVNMKKHKNFSIKVVFDFDAEENKQENGWSSIAGTKNTELQRAIRTHLHLGEAADSKQA
jgi:hypothetical protein